MGTTAQKLERLIDTKNGLREIITAKGVPVSESDTFNSYIDKIAAIKSDLAEVSITANGTYKASDQGVDGFSSVTVNVETGGSGGASLGSKTITENGIYNATKEGLDGYYSVDVNVPNAGKLIDKTITNVGTFNPSDDGADGYSSVTVDIDPETISAPTDKFTVNFYDGSDNLLLQVLDVPYGGFAEYPNVGGIKADPSFGTFYGWNPPPNNIKRNTNCYARYSAEGRPTETNEIIQSWETIIEAEDKGLSIPIGMFKRLHLGVVDGINYGSIRMQKVYEGEGASTSTWVAMDLVPVSKYLDSTDPFDAWDGSDLRTYLNGEFFTNIMPQVLKDAIVPVTKFSQGYNNQEVQTLDKIWIPSFTELRLGTKTSEPGTVYSDIFVDNQSRIRVPSGGTSPSAYFTRTIDDGTSSGNYNRIAVINTGSWTTVYSNSSMDGFLIGFCI